MRTDKSILIEQLEEVEYKHIILIDLEAEIVEGDLIYRIDTKEIIKCSNAINDGWIGQAGTGGVQRNLFIKIIASTNLIHNLPQLSEKSIKLLIDYNNNNGEMPKSVEVKTIEYLGIGLESNNDLKLNQQGTVDITIPDETKHLLKSKNTDWLEESVEQAKKEKRYTKEEVAKLCDSAFEAGEARGYEASPIEPDEYENISKEEWCKENHVLSYYAVDNRDYFYENK